MRHYPTFLAFALGCLTTFPLVSQSEARLVSYHRLQGLMAEHLVYQLKSKDPQVRERAVYTLGEMGPRASSSVSSLQKMMRTDGSPKVRAAAARALGKIKTRKVVGILIQGMHDKNEMVREAAAWGLGHMKFLARKAINPMTQVLLKEKSAKVQRAITLALSRMGSKGTASLLKGLKAKSPRARLYSVKALGKKRVSKQVLSALKQTLKNDRDADVRTAAAQAIERQGRYAVSALPYAEQTLFEDKNEKVKQASASAIAAMGAKGYYILSKALEQKDANVRFAAAIALKNAGSQSKATIKAMTRVLEDQDDRVRKTASQVLNKIGRKAILALGALKKLVISDPVDEIRLLSALTLGKLGPRAASAIPELQRAQLNDPHPQVRQASTWALEQIRARPAVAAAR